MLKKLFIKAFCLFILFFVLMLPPTIANKLPQLDSLMLVYETTYSFENNPELIGSIFSELSKGNNKYVLSFLLAHENKIKTTKNNNALVDVYSYLSEAYIADNNHDSCLYYANKASTLSKKLSDPLFEANSKVILGRALYINMKLDSANNILYEALHFLEKNYVDSKHLANCYSSLVKFYIVLGTPRKALDFGNKALHIYINTNEEVKISSLYYLMGNAYARLKNIEKARLFFNSSILLCTKHNYMRLLSANYYTMAELEKSLSKDSLSLYYIQKAINLDNKIERKYGLAFDYLALGKIYYSMDSLKLAKQTILESLKYSRIYNLSDITLLCLGNLVDIEYTEANYKEALDYNMQIKQFQDSLYTYVDIEKLQEVEKRYELEKQEFEFEIERQRTNFRSIILLISVCFVSLILFFLLFIQRIKTKRLITEQYKLTEEINFKNKELTTNVMYLANRNEFITSISKKLIKLKTNSDNQENIQILSEIVKDIKNNLNDELWKEFEMRFHSVHVDFYNSLNKHFPDLTINERRLSAFLKLNMTTKEISAITNQSISAIEMARSRLRSKLNIRNSDLGLSQYLAQF